MGNCMRPSEVENYERFLKEDWIGLRKSHALLKMEMLFHGDVTYRYVDQISEERPPLRPNYVEFELCDSIVSRTRWG